MVGIGLRLLSYPLPQFLHTNGGRCHPLGASLRPWNVNQPGPPDARPDGIELVFINGQQIVDGEKIDASVNAGSVRTVL
jgi:hypothetical protein